MADFGTPIAQTINPVGQGLQTLSQIMAFKQAQQGLQSGALGIQQQQQNLQTGQFQQAGAQAQSQQEQQKNSELQNLAAFAKNASTDPSFRLPDGSLDVNRFQEQGLKVAPVYGPPVIGQITTAANEQVSNQSALLGLTQQRRAVLSNMAASWASNPKVTGSQVVDDIESTRQEFHDDPQVSRMLTSLAAGGPVHGDSPTIQNWASGVVSRISGAGQLATTTNAGGQPVTQNKLTTAVTPTPGVNYGPGGVAPSSPSVAGQTVRTTGTANSDVDRYNAVSGAANNAPGAIHLSQQIDALADQISSGKISKALSSAAAAVGANPITFARSTLNKDLGQLKSSATSGATTDEARNTILSGYPDDTTNPQTIHTAMDYIRGTLRQTVARGQNAQAYVSAHPDKSGFQYSDNAIAQGSDPLMHEYQALPQGPARQAFIQRNFSSNPQGALEFVNKMKAAQHSGVLQ